MIRRSSPIRHASRDTNDLVAACVAGNVHAHSDRPEQRGSDLLQSIVSTAVCLMGCWAHAQHRAPERRGPTSSAGFVSRIRCITRRVMPRTMRESLRETDVADGCHFAMEVQNPPLAHGSRELTRATGRTMPVKLKRRCEMFAHFHWHQTRSCLAGMLNSLHDRTERTCEETLASCERPRHRRASADA